MSIRCLLLAPWVYDPFICELRVDKLGAKEAQGFMHRVERYTSRSE